MRKMWTYSDGALTVKGYWRPGSTAGAGAGFWSTRRPGLSRAWFQRENSRRFRPVDVFADVPGLPAYLGTVTAPDGTPLVDLVLDRNPFMLANGPRRWHGPMRSWCPAAIATDGPRPRLPNWRLVRRR